MQVLMRSVVSLTCQPMKLNVSWELCMYNGGYTDGTWELLRKLKDKLPIPLKLVRTHYTRGRRRQLALKLT